MKIKCKNQLLVIAAETVDSMNRNTNSLYQKLPVVHSQEDGLRIYFIKYVEYNII